MGRAKRTTGRAESLLLVPKSNGPRLSERRRAFQRHLQLWAYESFKSHGSFRGWISSTLDSKSYALGHPVACVVKPSTGEDSHHTRIHLKLFKRRTTALPADEQPRKAERGRAAASGAPMKHPPDTHRLGEGYYGMVRSGASWVTDEEWFTSLAHSQTQQGRLNSVPYRLRSSSTNTAGTQQRQTSKFAPLPVQSIRTGDWMHLGPPLRLLDLPRDVRLHILDFVLQLPDTLIFDGVRQTTAGREQPRQTAALRNFRSCSAVPCRQFTTEVLHLLYSTTTFAFYSLNGLLDFLTNIGESNRALVRKLRLHFTYYDYFDLFTPDWLTSMLDVPIWSRSYSKLRSFLSAMHLEELTVRLKDDCAPGFPGDPWHGLTSLSKPWVCRSVLAFFPRARFESATWPHRDAAEGLHWSWDSLIHAGLDKANSSSSLGPWLGRPPKSLFLRHQRLLRRRRRCRLGCTAADCRGDCGEESIEMWKYLTCPDPDIVEVLE